MKYKIVPLTSERPRVSYSAYLATVGQHLPEDRISGFSGALFTGLSKIIFQMGDYLIHDASHQFYRNFDLTIKAVEGLSPGEVLSVFQEKLCFSLEAEGVVTTYSLLVRHGNKTFVDRLLGGDSPEYFGRQANSVEEVRERFGIEGRGRGQGAFYSREHSVDSFYAGYKKRLDTGWYPESSTITLETKQRTLYRLK